MRAHLLSANLPPMRLISRASALVVIALGLGCAGLTERHVIYPQVAGKRHRVTMLGRVTAGELAVLQESLRLVGGMTPFHYENPERIPVYWMRSEPFDGLTLRSTGEPVILVNVDHRRQLYTGEDLFRLGSVYAHELSHSLHGTHDPDTGEITDRLLVRLRPSFDAYVRDWKPIRP